MNKLTMIDLFAGTGAFSYVANKHGIKCIYANDLEESSKKIYDINHENKLSCKDIHKIKIKKIGNHNILCAGFPCQPFFKYNFYFINTVIDEHIIKGFATALQNI